jgi:hypothetical protein
MGPGENHVPRDREGSREPNDDAAIELIWFALRNIRWQGMIHSRVELAMNRARRALRRPLRESCVN